jgi:hypothetical protein
MIVAGARIVVLLVILTGCYVLPARKCDAPVIYPKSPPAQVGVKNTPSCQDYILDFDAKLWFTPHNEDAPKLCGPGDTVMLVDPTHVQYIRADGTSIEVGSPAHSHRMGCA